MYLFEDAVADAIRATGGRAQVMAGIISAIAGGSEAEGGADAAPQTGEAALTTYSDTYEFVMWYAIGAGVVMLLLAKPINKLMHGIK